MLLMIKFEIIIILLCEREIGDLYIAAPSVCCWWHLSSFPGVKELAAHDKQVTATLILTHLPDGLLRWGYRVGWCVRVCVCVCVVQCLVGCAVV